MSPNFDKLPPTNLGAESAVLSAILLDNTCLDRVMPIVTSADFFDTGNARLFAVLCDAREVGKPFDPRVILQLIKLPQLEGFWTAASVAALFENSPAVAHATFYALEIRKAAVLRRQVMIAAEVGKLATQPEADPAEITNWLDGQMAMLESRQITKPKRFGEVVMRRLEDLDRPEEARASMAFTGLANVDASLGGMASGELIILAARPSQGKSALGFQIGVHNASKGRQVLFVSLEMTDRDLVTRQLCGDAGVDSRRVRMGDLTNTEKRSLMDAGSRLYDIPLDVWDPSRASMADIRGAARLCARSGNLRLLVIDYLNLITPRDRRVQRHEQIGEVTASLKALAKELSIPVIALCQLNRESEKFDKPKLSHLKESGNIEQDADQVWFIHHTNNSGEAMLIVGKHRAGDKGELSLRWIPKETRFEETNREGGFDNFNERGGQ